MAEHFLLEPFLEIIQNSMYQQFSNKTESLLLPYKTRSIVCNIQYCAFIFRNRLRTTMDSEAVIFQANIFRQDSSIVFLFDTLQAAQGCRSSVQHLSSENFFGLQCCPVTVWRFRARIHPCLLPGQFCSEPVDVFRLHQYKLIQQSSFDLLTNSNV